MQLEQEDKPRQLAAEQATAAVSGSLWMELPDAIMLVDQTGQVVQANPAAEQLWGYDRASLVHQQIDDLVDGERSLLAAARTTLAQTGGWHGTLRICHSNGSRSPRDLRISTLRHDGTVYYAVIAEREQPSTPDGVPLPLLKAALEQANDAIVITTAELDLPGPQIVYVNAAFSELTGYSPAELLGQTPRILQGPETDRTELDCARAALMRGEAYRGELINYRKDGSSYIMEWRIAPVRAADGTLTHWVSIQRDISGLKQAADERDRLYQEARTAIQARNQLLTMVSHELKTPLTSLMGYSYLLQRAQLNDPQARGRVEHAVEVIANQAQRLNVLIEGLLDLDRMESGALQIQPQPVDLADLMRRVIAEFQPVLERHSLTLECPPDPQMVSGDELRLRHALQHLIQNAITYSPRGGPISVRIAPQPEQICISVTDRGIGIPATAETQVFERFYRASNVNPSQISGFGVGLYVVQQIITGHGGTVAVSSAEGEGSTFTICLPQL